MFRVFISFLLSAKFLLAMGSELNVDTNITLFNSTLAISKSTVHDRMQHWVDAAVPYSQSAYYEGYRTDCSGYVSMGWQLSTSYWTGSLTEVCHKITSGIAMGDAILCQTCGHVIMFDKWTDSNHDYFMAYQEQQTGTTAMYYKTQLSKLYNEGYFACRYNNIS
mmetsp:Transcript_16093/g.23449  ORF Transcript_16093/g.23449 Transcript_16093/m.23449 type:complete len:164 (+) Transcript_16093:1479-1970(+)